MDCATGGIVAPHAAARGSVRRHYRPGRASHVRRRVKAQYGYVVVDGGPRPNLRKAAEGHQLRVLAVDDATADVVRRIFAEKLDGAGDQPSPAG